MRQGSPQGSTNACNALSCLSVRQREVLQLLTRGGHSEKTAAAALGISERTLHTHVCRVYRKLRIRSRSELFAWLWQVSSDAANLVGADIGG
jgi:DNA-binding CsgD family transcriptional regulator